MNIKKILFLIFVAAKSYAMEETAPTDAAKQSVYVVDVADWERQVGTGLTTWFADTDLNRLQQRVSNHHKRQACQAFAVAAGTAVFTGGMLGLFYWLDKLKHQ